MFEDVADERSGPRPTIGIGFEPGISGVAEHAGDGDVGEPDLVEQVAGGRELTLQIVDGGRNVLFQGPCDPLLSPGSPQTNACTTLG